MTPRNGVSPTQDIGAGIGTPQGASGPQGVQPWAAPLPPAQPLSEPQEAAKWSRLRLRHFTASGTGVGASVTTGATSVAVTFARQEPDTSYGLVVLPSWDTTVYVPEADKAKTGFTARFGTAPAGSAGVIQWATFRSED